MKPLHIPKRDRKKGEYIQCVYTGCKTTLSGKCKLSGKSQHTCKHGDSHRFLSKAYDPEKRRMVPIMLWPKELRDYKEFTRKHILEVQKFESYGKSNPLIQIRPSRLQDAVKAYFEWYCDISVPPHKRKNYSEKVQNNEFNNLREIKKALPDYTLLKVTDFNDDHVGLIYDHLSQYANKTFNNKIYTIKSFFNYLISIGYDIKNPMDGVKNKIHQPQKTFIHPEDFSKLLSLITEENGIKFEKDGDKIKRKSLFRPWLNFYYRLALSTGGRPDGLTGLKYEDITPDFVRLHNTKVENKKNIDIIQLIIRTQEFNEVFEELCSFYNLRNGDYVLEPEETNRKKLSNHASKAWTHYWRQGNFHYKATCYELKDTHITLMLGKIPPELYQGMYGAHKELKTSIENYAKEEILVGNYKGVSLLG